MVLLFIICLLILAVALVIEVLAVAGGALLTILPMIIDIGLCYYLIRKIIRKK